MSSLFNSLDPAQRAQERETLLADLELDTGMERLLHETSVPHAVRGFRADLAAPMGTRQDC